ncbi:MAG: N-6 DNA methylase [Alcaligenaceae bacterium]|nr:N-6 DNA methylase [Alcaligenaceae bacterium]
MYSRLFQELTRLIPSVSSRRAPVKETTALQLIAWARASRLGRLPANLAFDPALGLEHGGHIALVFQKIHERGALQNASLVFTETDLVLHDLHTRSIQRIQSLLAASFDDLQQPWPVDDFLNEARQIFDPLRLDFLPKELVQLMVTLAGVRASTPVYIPFEASFQLSAAVQAQGGLPFAQVFQPNNLPAWLDLLSDVKNLAVSRLTPQSFGTVTNELPEPCPFTLSFLPERMDHAAFYADSADAVLTANDQRVRFPVTMLQHILHNMQQRAVVVMPGRFVSSSRVMRFMARELLPQAMVDAVVALPAGMMHRRSGGLTLLVLSRGAAHSDMLFVDGTHPCFQDHTDQGLRLQGWKDIADLVLERKETSLSTKVPVSDVRANNFSLRVASYCIPDHSYLFKAWERQFSRCVQHHLGELVNIVRSLVSPSRSGTHPVKRIRFSSFEGGHGYLKPDGETTLIDDEGVLRADRFLLHPLDIVLASVGGTVKVGIVPPFIDHQETVGWMAGPTMTVLRVRNPAVIDPHALYFFLVSAAGRAQLEGVRANSGEFSLSTSALQEMLISVPDSDGQQQLIQAFDTVASIESRIADLRTRQAMLLEQPIEAAGITGSTTNG